MNLITLFTLISSLSFLGYAYSYFKTPHMKHEFKRFGLEKMGLTIVLLEIIGARNVNTFDITTKVYRGQAVLH